MASRKHRRIPVVGVTGAIGSGKSAVARFFAKWGGVIVSGDEIGHRVVARSAAIRRNLAREFGGDILRAGQIDRALLSRRAFASPEKTLALNRIVHPALIRELKRDIQLVQQRPRTKAVVIDAALLVEWGIGLIQWDYLVGVRAPYTIRVERLRRRGLSRQRIRDIAGAQMPWSRKRTYCDCIVKNDASMSILQRRARLCWDKMLLFDRED